MVESLGFPSGYALFEGNDSTSSFLEVCGLAEHLEEPQTPETRGLRHTLPLHPSTTPPRCEGNDGYRAWALSTENSEVAP